MSTAWEGFRAVLGELLTPLMDRRIGNPQVASDLRNGLPTGLSQSHRFTLKLGCLGLLNLLHDPGPPSGRVYPKLSLLHNFGVRSHPPFGRLTTRGCLCIVGGADPLGGWRDSVIGTKVDLALNQFQLLEPNLSQELYCWNMVQPVECSQLQSTGDSHLPQ